MRNRIEVPGQISVNYFGVPLINRPVDGSHGIERTALGTVPVGRLIEVRFEDRFEHQRRRGLYDPVADRGNTERPLAHATGFRNHHASNRLRFVAFCPNLLSQFAEPALHSVDFDARKGFPIHTWGSTIRPAKRECVCEDVFTPHLVIQKMESPRRLLLGLHVQRSLERPDSFGSCQAHANPPLLSSSKRTSNQGAFPPPALSGFLSTVSPSDTCRARLPLEPLPGVPGSPTGLPCCESPRVYVSRPLPRRAGRPSHVGRSGRPRRPSSIERRLGARIQPFEACSGFTRVAARTLAGPPKADLCPQSFDSSVTLAIVRVATKAYRHLLGPDLHRLR